MIKLLIVLSLLTTVAMAGQVGWNRCTDDGTFTLQSLDVEGCSGGACIINAGQTYEVTFAGCYTGPVSPVNKIPFDVDALFLNLLGPSVIVYPVVVNDDLCQNFTADSYTTSCPVTAPSPCGKWLIHVKAPFFQLPMPLPILGFDGVLRATGWVNDKSHSPVMCAEFPIKYRVL